MVVPVCECERGEKRSTTSILQCEILYFFAWVVLWMRTRKKASASCVIVRNSPLSSVCECERGKSEAQQAFCNVNSSVLFASWRNWSIISPGKERYFFMVLYPSFRVRVSFILQGYRAFFIFTAIIVHSRYVVS